MTENSEYRDELPEDLQPSYVSPTYKLPTTTRRRNLSIFSFLFAALAFALYISSPHGVFVNNGYLVFAILMVALAIYFWLSAWPMTADEKEALVIGTKESGMTVGHASVHLGWVGFRSRPTWRLLLYSAENPPRERAVVLVDGVKGEVVYKNREANPEDWSTLTVD